MSIAEKLTTIAENEQKVYDAGKKSEYDKFWDAYQNYGRRINYTRAFYGEGWNDNIFKPKHKIKPTNANQMFSSNSIKDYGATDIDLSEATDISYLFYYSVTTHIPDISTVSSPTLEYVFAGCYLAKTLDRLILKDDGSQSFVNVFRLCTSLENILIEGTIGQGGFNVSWSPLNKASLTSVVNALSSTTTGLTVTLRLSAVNSAFETSEGAMDGSTSDEWLALAATKANWTISLINS